jgi:hypothetical protein
VLFEPIGATIHIFLGFFVLVLLLVIVLEQARSITITSTIRFGGLSTSTRESLNRATSKGASRCLLA